MKRRLTRGALVLAAVGALSGLVLVSGVVPVAASSGHWWITRKILHFAMQRSVATHSLGIQAPPLDDPDLVLRGAGHYEGGCRFCHGAPGIARPPIPMSMTPHPPDLGARVGEYDDAALFYIVRHGIKMTAMPAWPAAHRDDEVWAVVAFLRRMPDLDAGGYRALVLSDEDPGDAPAVVVEQCARCHGIDGQGRGDEAFPILAAQREQYLANSLRAYAAGDRASGLMIPIAAILSEEEIAAAARWYASRPAPPASAGEPADGPGATLVREGLPERRIPACASCHGPGEDAEHPAYPILAGQPEWYLETQLELFAAGHRGGSEFAELMESVTAHGLTPDLMDAAARYYAALPPPR